MQFLLLDFIVVLILTLPFILSYCCLDLKLSLIMQELFIFTYDCCELFQCCFLMPLC